MKNTLELFGCTSSTYFNTKHYYHSRLLASSIVEDLFLATSWCYQQQQEVVETIFTQQKGTRNEGTPCWMFFNTCYSILVLSSNDKNNVCLVLLSSRQLVGVVLDHRIRDKKSQLASARNVQQLTPPASRLLHIISLNLSMIVNTNKFVISKLLKYYCYYSVGQWSVKICLRRTNDYVLI